MIKLAVVIQAHKNPKQVQLLHDSLKHFYDVYIHWDNNPYPFNGIVLTRVKGKWGTWSLTDQQISCFLEIDLSKYTHVAFISGQTLLSTNLENKLEKGFSYLKIKGVYDLNYSNYKKLRYHNLHWLFRYTKPIYQAEMNCIISVEHINSISLIREKWKTSWLTDEYFWINNIPKSEIKDLNFYANWEGCRRHPITFNLQSFKDFPYDKYDMIRKATGAITKLYYKRSTHD